MQPLRFEPILKQTLWGGGKIIPYKHLDVELPRVGESWELSGVKGSESVVAGGEFAGRPLPALIEELRGKLVGEKVYARFGNEFPLLIKFIDAREDLSIQVHPDDRLAAERHGSKGKTEMWYVVDADPGSHLLTGFSRQITPEEYAARVADNTITEVLRRYEIRPGDCFFLPAGRIHSIGAGAFIAEIQQTSDITYRIYDFNRRDAQGSPRELHTELAKAAIDYTVLPDYRTRYAESPDCEVRLAECPYFVTSLFDLTRPMSCDLTVCDSFTAVIVVDGAGELADDTGGRTPLRRGETLLIPAATRQATFIPDGRMKVLTSRIA